MKKLTTLSCAVLLGLAGSVAFADDVRVDEALRLVNEGQIQALDQLNDKALAVQPGDITDTELEHEYGRYVYKVEIRDAQGAEWDVKLDASSGEVLRHKRDN
ncbi:PepSY domain-containing protein [Halopseudomonas phragmitis]|uniref:Peptidase n=2 Tax=Pseudomonadaceae TaxID=135621 RepID=A0A1V0B639_9GAMM|nr:MULTISPECIES: PepSY domain-containing protein [Pseudomonadaceae]AQZ95398.1 peptidase [Halopseudomonas phragmitis]RHW22450.1 peptidase [Pseudomonas jilinensis]